MFVVYIVSFFRRRRRRRRAMYSAYVVIARIQDHTMPDVTGFTTISRDVIRTSARSARFDIKVARMRFRPL